MKIRKMAEFHESLFLQVASHLNLPLKFKQKCLNKFSAVIGSDPRFLMGRMEEWSGIFLYFELAQFYSEGNTLNNTITVSDLLRITKIHCTNFMKKLRVMLEAIGSNLSVEVVRDAESLQRSYLMSAYIFDKFSRIFSEVFVLEVSEDYQIPSPCRLQPNYSVQITERRTAIWLIYLLAKDKLGFDDGDLVKSFYYLLCSFIPVIQSTPSFLLQHPPPNSQGSLNRDEQQLKILSQLCEENQADVDELFIPILQSQPWRDFIQNLGLLALPNLTCKWFASLKPLQINSLDFTQPNSQLITRNRNRVTDTPVPGAVVEATPVYTRLTSIQRLKAVLREQSSSTIRSQLNRFYTGCTTHPQSTIETRVASCRQSYIDSHTQNLNEEQKRSSTESFKQRFDLMETLYYRSLNGLLNQESSRLSQNDFTRLLDNELFHRSLMCSSCLVISHTYNPQEPTRRALIQTLEIFNVQPFHMCKVIECFIRAEPELSSGHIAHLHRCENAILEELAWARGSPYFALLDEGDVARDGNASPVGASVFLSPAKPTSTPSRKKSKALSVFITKVSRLAYHRLSLLCTSLTISSNTQAKIWTCLEYCIQTRSDLMEDRHLDTIMLCCLYSINKVVDTEIRFKVIVASYKQQPYHIADSELTERLERVYKRVYMGDRSPTASVIEFYNQVFMQTTKSYLLQFSPNRRQTPHLSPAPKQSPRTHAIKHNVFVSPLKEEDSRPSVLLTPRSSQLYSFGAIAEGRGSQLESINESVRRLASPSSSATKRHLTFSTTDQAPSNSSSSSRGVPPSSATKHLKF